MCNSGKAVFTKRQVQEWLNSNPDKKMREYHCDRCNMWHLTHTKKVSTRKWTPKLKHKAAFKKFLTPPEGE